MTADELERRMSNREFTEWGVEFRLREEDREKRRAEERAGSGAEHRARHPQRRR